MTETWAKAILQGSADLVKSIGGVLFSPQLSEKIMEVPVYKWEHVIAEAFKDLKSEKSAASIIEETTTNQRK